MLSSHRLALPLAAALLLTAATAGAEPGRGEGWLSGGSRIEEAISGTTHLRGRTDGGGGEVEYHAADGKVAYLLDGCLWSGRWWAEEDRLCYAYPSLSGETAHCFYLRDGPAGLEYWSVEDPGARQPLAWVKSVLEGNPQELAMNSGGHCEDT
ncbi:MAG: hypothetical protein GDA47_02430 [Rhodospirillales bacterium]|nr:hypothetical protein [Rhodospirillales bacterium]